MLTITFRIDWLASYQVVAIVANALAIPLLGIKCWQSAGTADWDIFAFCLVAAAINCVMGIVMVYCLAYRLRDSGSCWELVGSGDPRRYALGDRGDE